MIIPTIKQGDLVKIVTPLFVIRVGYPFGINYAEEFLVTKEEKTTIRKLCGENYSSISKCFSKILKEVAYTRLISCGFGGPYRTIHTKCYPHMEGKIDRVMDKKVVVTGKRYSGSGSYDDCEPCGFSYSKRHVLLMVGWSEDFLVDLWTEQTNVIKIP